MNQWRILAGVIMIVSLVAVASACSSAPAPPTSSPSPLPVVTPTSQAQPSPTLAPTALDSALPSPMLAQATPAPTQVFSWQATLQHLQTITSYHFTTSTSAGATRLSHGEGDIARPDKGSSTLIFDSTLMNTDTVWIGSTIWSRSGDTWNKMEAGSTPGTLPDPLGLLTAATLAANLGSTKLAGVPVRYVQVTLGNQAEAGSKANLWIDSATGDILQMEFGSTSTTSGTAVLVTTTMQFSRIDDPTIKIVPPSAP